MSELQTIELPDMGDIDSVEVIEVLVSVGDQVVEEQSLATVESDKASTEVPSPANGTVTAILVGPGDKVSAGSHLLIMDVSVHSAEPDAVADQPDTQATDPANSATAAQSATANTDSDTSLVVIGGGPGGYTAAFRAADLGLDVVMIERYPDLGGVCLNVGCIPSKALLHTAAVMDEVTELPSHGITYGAPEINLDTLRGFKEGVIKQLTGGLAGLAKQRKITVVHGVAEFDGSNSVSVKPFKPGKDAGGGDADVRRIGFKQAIIASGSESIRLPGLPYDDPRLIDSTGALELQDIPERLLVIGGGIIGLEMGCVYAALGSQVSVVELSSGLMPGADRDLVRPLERRLKKKFASIRLDTKVTAIEATDDALVATFANAANEPAGTESYDRVLLAIGRSPNGNKVNAQAAGVDVDERGFISVDQQMRTNVPHIFAIGDVVGQPMLAHKATHEGKTAAEVAAGHKVFFDPMTIPSVAYTDPEVAWMGLTETDAKEQDIAYETASFPWAASGRSLSMARNEGVTKILYDPGSKRLLGAGMTGTHAGELIAEAVLALEMGADIEDIALTVHPHPTLSETFNFACEVAEGTVTDIYAPKKPARKLA